MSAEIVRWPPPRRLREDLAAQMAALFPHLSEEMQRAYIELTRFQLGEPIDVAALERVASEDALWTLPDDVQSVIDDIYETFPHIGEDDEAEKKDRRCAMSAAGESILRDAQQRIDRLPPDAHLGEVLRIRLQILRNALRLVPGPTDAARAVLLEQVDDLAGCIGVTLGKGGAR